MGEGGCMVVDDLQNLNPESPVGSALESLIRVIPDDFRLFLISRQPIELDTCDWETERRVLRLGNGHFKLSCEEVIEFFRESLGTDIPEEEARQLITRTDGLIAKLSLYEGLERNIPSDTTSLLDLRIPKDELEELIHLAELPEVTRGLVSDIGCSPKAMDILATLCTGGVLVSSHGGLKEKFILHDLLKEYLRSKAKEIMGDEYRNHLHNVALALYRNGYLEDSVNLLHRIGSYGDIFGIFIEALPGLIYSGRLYSIQAFVNLLQNSPYAQDPWILYAEAVVNKFTSPHYTVSLLERCIEEFGREGVKEGEKFAIGELFDVIQYLGEDFAIAGKFLDRVDSLLSSENELSPTDLMLLAYTGIVHLLHRGDSERASLYFNRIEEILDNFNEPAEREMSTYLSYIKLYSAIVYDTAGDIPKAEIAFKEAQYLFKNAIKTHQSIFMYSFLASMHETFIGRFKSAADRMRRVEKEFYSWEIIIHEEHLITRVFEAVLCEGNIKEADRIAERLRDIETGSSFSRAMTLQLMAQYYLMKKRLTESLRCAEESIELFEKIHGEPFVESTKSLLALTLIELGRFDSAKELLMETLIWSRRRKAELQRFTTLMYLALLYIRMGKQESAKTYLRNALELARRCTFKATYNGFPSLISEILSYAMLWGIEEEYVKQLIMYHDLKPPKQALSERSWSWKLRIHTFGKLRVIVNDRELSSQDWKGNRAFNLLKALLYLGGKDVPVGEIVNLIWSEHDGNKAFKSFEFTLRKLRSILTPAESREPVLILKNKKLSLNPNITWVDMWEFERLCETLREDSPANPSRQECIERLRKIYEGAFMEGEREFWLEGKRESFKKMFKDYSTSTQTPLR
jgi:ATP/maltotriose-dependent transcriptional regulator MalT